MDGLEIEAQHKPRAHEGGMAIPASGMRPSAPAERSAVDQFEIKKQLVAGISDNHKIPIISNAVLAVVFAYAVRNMVEIPLLSTWLALVLIVAAGRLLWVMAKPLSLESEKTVSSWVNQFSIGAGISGLFWGGGALLFFPAASPEFQVFTAFIVGGLAAGAVVSYGAWLPAFFAFVVPSLLPLSIRFFFEMSETASFMGGVLLFYGLVVSALGYRFYRTTVNSVSLQLTQVQLVNQRDTSEAFFSRAFHSSPAVFSISRLRDGLLYDVNDAWCDLTGYTREEATSKPAADLGVWTYPEQREEFISSLKKEGTVHGFEAVFRTKTGAERDLLIAGELIRVNGEDRLLFIAQDISKLKEVERLKSEFVSIVSHELRTPLTSIQGGLGVALSGSIGDISGKVRDMLEIASKNASRLNSLVNDILDFEKLQSGQMEFRFQTLKLDQLVRETVLQCQPYAEEYGVEFNIALADELLIRGDEQRLIQVVSNLLSNAAKYSKSGDTVDISIEKQMDGARVSVRDNGPGVDLAFQEKIFDRFSQADSSDTRSVGGSGLGLNISRSIMDAHHGTIDFVSEMGKGSTFFIELPLLK